MCEEPFSDADEEDWYWGNICRMYAAEIVQGRDLDSFAPDGNMTRAEAIKVLMLLSDTPPMTPRGSRKVSRM